MVSILAGVSARLSWLGHFTIFTAYQPQRAMELGYPSGAGLVALFALGFLCAGASVVVFQRRDAIG